MRDVSGFQDKNLLNDARRESDRARSKKLSLLIDFLKNGRGVAREKNRRESVRINLTGSNSKRSASFFEERSYRATNVRVDGSENNCQQRLSTL